MRIVQIPKGKGLFRTIYVPNDEEMKTLRALLPKLNVIQKLCDRRSACQHGFFESRSPLTNAIQHIGFRYTLKMDLKDFFDTVNRAMFINVEHLEKHGLKIVEFDQCFVDGFARQGLPTSPMVANMAASDMDDKIMALSRRDGRFDNRFVYTRYADDLTFSFDEARIAGMLKQKVPEIITAEGFVLNEKKTKLQCSAVGRRIITGIGVDDTGAHPTRRMKRKLRAAKHQRNIPQARGIQEWLRLRLPSKYVKPASQRFNTVLSIAHDAVTGAEQATVVAVSPSVVEKVVGWVRRRFNSE